MGSSTPATTTENKQTSPWSEATPLLKSLIGQYSGMVGNAGPTDAQTSATNNLISAAGSIPNFGDTAAAGVNKLFGSDTSAQAGMLSNGYSQLQQNLGTTADGSQLNPYSTPGFSDALNTTMDDITNRVKGTYAASGRAPSGAGSFAGSLGRGLTQGISPLIQSQYNANKSNQMNAAGTLFNASGTTASGITAQNQVPLQNILSGIQGAGALTGLYTSPAAAQVSAANTQQQQPYQNLQQLLSAAGILGGMGSSSSGTGTQTPANNPTANWIGGLTAGAGLLFSDARLKDNIERVGATDDGLGIYRYNFKGDDTPQIGLLAQEVAETKPHAVHDVGGVLAVDYKAATTPRHRVPKMGMLEFSEAA